MLYRFNEHPQPGFYDKNGKLVTSSTTSVGNVRTRRPNQVTANAGFGGFGGGSVGGGVGGGSSSNAAGLGGMTEFGGGQSGATVDRYNPVRDRLEEGSIVEDWIPRDASGLDDMFMLMYHRDAYAGTVVDLISDLIWCEYDLMGVQDKEILKIYQDSLEAINVVSTMPDLTREYLVLGRSVSSMIFDKGRGIFKDLVNHDPSMIRLTPIPIKGFDPKIDLIPSPALKMFVDSNDPRDLDAKKILPPAYLDAIRKASSGGNSNRKSGMDLGNTWMSASSAQGSMGFGGMPLDPINTLFVARKVFNRDMIGTSLFTRLINFWALEKALINATMASTRRRSRSILHVKAGIDNLWEPTAQEMDNIAGMFIQADEDPVGAVVTTRTGVDATEIRQGQDFYKWSDEWQLLTEGKLRALGANDALLCLSGDTLIPTKEHGLLRIDTFGNRSVDEELSTMGRCGPDKTAKWMYSGRGKALQIKTHHGNVLRCTPGHRILVLSGNDLVWKMAKELNTDDVLCLNKQECLRDSKLPLELTTVAKKKCVYSHNGSIVEPKFVTPDLAYIIGMLVSKGRIGRHRLRVSDTNLSILEGVKHRIHSVFGSDVKVTISPKAGKGRIDKNGTVWKTVKQVHELCVWSMVVCDYLKQMGLTVSPGKTSKRKTVPWAILQSDANSQLSYLAAYIDGDGTVKRDGSEIRIRSSSPQLLLQTQAILFAHGVDSLVRNNYLQMTYGNSASMSQKLVEFSLSGKFDNVVGPEFPDREHGINTDGIKKLLRDRFVGKIANVSVFRNDQNGQVLTNRFSKKSLDRWDHLTYRSFEAGEYDDILLDLEKISASEYHKVLILLSKKFKYTQVAEIKSLEEEVDLYDIQMVADPSFTANGIIVHNSGDATYSNQESARLFFMEKAVNLRKVLTNRTFSNRLFPLIARIHGFVKRTPAELSHRVRTTKLTQHEALSIPNSDLIIPEIRWRKQLLNNFDEKKLEILEKMDEKGVPVTLRDWASAGDINIDSQTASLATDTELRQRVAKWKASFSEEGSEREARLEFLNSLKTLSHAKLNQVLGSTENHLGPLNQYIFWDREGQLGGLKAKELTAFLSTIDPSTNSVQILKDKVALTIALERHFKDTVLAQIAHYLIYRTDFTPIIPTLEEEAQNRLEEAIQASIDQYKDNGSLYQLFKVVERELKTINSLGHGKREEALAKLEKTVGKMPKREPLANNDPGLYAGKG